MYQYGRLWSRSVQYIMKQLINVKYISSCGDNNLYTVYISRFYDNLNYRRKYDPLFPFFISFISEVVESWFYTKVLRIDVINK